MFETGYNSDQWDVWDTEAPLDDEALYTDDGYDYEGYTDLYSEFYPTVAYEEEG